MKLIEMENKLGICRFSPTSQPPDWALISRFYSLTSLWREKRQRRILRNKVMKDLPLSAQYLEIPRCASGHVAGRNVVSRQRLTRTDDELSVVCDQSSIPNGVKSELGWNALKVVGPLDFGLTGILSSIAQPLAIAEISIFAISTFDTDYVLVKSECINAATSVLESAGFDITREQGDSSGSDAAEKLEGNWKLVEFNNISQNGTIQKWGGRLSGRLTYLRGNVTVAINRWRETSTGIKDEKHSFYSGTFKKLDSMTVEHEIEASSDLGRIGNKLIRNFKIENDSLTLEGEGLTGGVRLLWKRMGDSL